VCRPGAPGSGIDRALRKILRMEERIRGPRTDPPKSGPAAILDPTIAPPKVTLTKSNGRETRHGTGRTVIPQRPHPNISTRRRGTGAVQTEAGGPASCQNPHHPFWCDSDCPNRQEP